MIRARLGSAMRVAEFFGVLALGWGGSMPLGPGNLWAQAPAGSSGIIPLPPNSPNNPANFNPTMGSPVAPTQPPSATFRSGGSDDDPTPAPTRKAFSPAFGAAGAPPAGTAAAAGARNPALIANSAAGQPAASRLQFDPPEKMVFEGAEVIAWVGSIPILSADVMYETNKLLAKFAEDNAPKVVPPEMIAQGRVIFMKQKLKVLIETKLIFIEAMRNIPADAVPKIEKGFNDTFDKMYLRKMMEGEGCGSLPELDAKFRRMGTTVEAVRRQTFESAFAARWLDDHVKSDDEITHENMQTYYREHFTEYEKPRRLRWEHLMARFSKFDSKADAFQAIAQWGNEVLRGTPFADVAKAHSHDPSASDGGVHPWTNEGSLRSAVLDRALFELPADKLSQIIEDDRGFHIVRVIERDDTTCMPFTEAQPEIRKKIREERSSDRRNDYLDKLRAKIPVWNLFEQSETPRTAAGATPERR